MQEELLSLFLPSCLLDHFEIVDFEDSQQEIHIHLDEKNILPKSFLGNSQYTRSKGFTEATVIQDFPIRAKAVYLHLRRRRWINLETNYSFTSQYDISQEGTKLTKELVAFLKEFDRE